MVLASFILFGCSEEVKNQKNGSIELQNTNPTINQEHFDAMVSKIKSEITNSDFKIYSIENTFNEPYKSKITEETINKLLSEKAENKLIRDTDLTLATSVFIVSEKDETEFFYLQNSTQR